MYSSVVLCLFTLLCNQSPELRSSYKLKLYPLNSYSFLSPPRPWQPSSFIFKTALFNIIHKPYDSFIKAYTIQLVLAYVQSCAAITSFQIFLSPPQKETSYLSRVTPYSFFSQPLTTTNLLSVSVNLPILTHFI